MTHPTRRASPAKPFRAKVRPFLILASPFGIAIACGGVEGHGVRCGPGTVEHAGQCVLESGGTSRPNEQAGDAGTTDRGGANAVSGGASSPPAGEGGNLGGASDEDQGGQTFTGDAGNSAGGSENAGDSAGGGANGCELLGGDASEGGTPGLSDSSSVCTTGPIQCTPDQDLPNGGAWPITRTDTIIALSDTTVVFGNQVNNTLDVLDLCTGKTRWRWQLPSAPGAAVLDRPRRLIYVTLLGASSVAKVSLDAACIEQIAVPLPAVSLALGNDATLFARLDDTHPGSNDKPISIIDALARRVLATRRGPFDKFIAFRRATNRLFTGSIYGGVRAFEYDSQLLQFTKGESSAEMSYPCSDLQLSPDQSHLYFACSNGVTPTPVAQGADFNPVNLASPFGVYDSGASASAMAYSPGSARLFTMAGSQVVEYDVATHARMHTYAIPAATRLSVAPSGRVLVGGGYWNVASSTTTLNWAQLAAPDCKP